MTTTNETNPLTREEVEAAIYGGTNDVTFSATRIIEALDALAAARAELADANARANGDAQRAAAYQREMQEARAEVERLKGITPELPPFPPAGEGLPRYGLRWNGKPLPLAVPRPDGYWTPAHLAEAEVARLTAEKAADAEYKATLVRERDEARAALPKSCETCGGDGFIEIPTGHANPDGEYEEWTAEPCPDCDALTKANAERDAAVAAQRQAEAALIEAEASRDAACAENLRLREALERSGCAADCASRPVDIREGGDRCDCGVEAALAQPSTAAEVLAALRAKARREALGEAGRYLRKRAESYARVARSNVTPDGRARDRVLADELGVVARHVETLPPELFAAAPEAPKPASAVCGTCGGGRRHMYGPEFMRGEPCPTCAPKERP